MQAPLRTRNDTNAPQTDTARTVAQKRVLADNRLEAVAQRKLAEMMNNSPRLLQQRELSDAIHNSPRMVAQRHEMNALFGGAVRPQGDGAMSSETSPAQREEKPNNTGLPNQLKSGIEALSGMSMGHVNVHYNSDKPAQLQAHAYAQGSEIHVAPGQEKHLPHEAWHVVQQAQGRVRPTLQMKAGAVNDDPSLEKEADILGDRAAQFKSIHAARNPMAKERIGDAITQRVVGLVPAQRVKETEKSAQSDEVSDIPTEDVKKLTLNISSRPQQVLDDMKKLDIIKSLKGIPPLAEIGISYVEDGADFGEAFYDANETPKFRIAIYKLAFDGGISVVYSTLRHELIHIGQYYKHIDANAATSEAPSILESDVVFDEPLSDDHKTQAIAASEIETYAWEITSAVRTGVSKSYIYTRAVALQNFWQDLRMPNKNRAKMRTITEWRGKVKELFNQAKRDYEMYMDVKWPKAGFPETYEDAAAQGNYRKE